MYDVIIIGSGFSGLSSADILTESHKSVLIIEAQHRIGGRCFTDTHSPHPVDLGCSTIHGYNEGSPVRELIHGLGIHAYVPKKSRNIVSSPQGLLSPDLIAKLQSSITRANTLTPTDPTIPTTRSSSSYLFSPQSPLHTSLTSEETLLVDSLIRTSEIGLGVTLEELALKWIGYEDAFKGTDAIPIGGFGKVIEALETKVKSNGAVVAIGEKVISITKPFNRPLGGGEDDSMVVVTNNERTGQEKVYEGRLVISTIPLSVLKQPSSLEIFNPPLSEKKIEAIEGTHVGQLGKLLITYPKTWWEDDIGTITILPSNPGKSQQVDPKDPAALLDTVTLVASSFAVPSNPTPHSTLLIYLPAPVTKLLESLPSHETALAFHNLLISRLSPTSPPPPPSSSTITSWSLSPYSLGATTTPPIISRSPLDFITLGKPEWDGRLLFAGEHTSVCNRGSVAGAVESGVREGERARRLLMNWE